MGHVKTGNRQEVLNYLTRKPVGGMVCFLRRIKSAYFLRNAVVSYTLKNLKGYLYHETNYVLEPYAGPSIATIHDLSYLHYPHYHPKERIWHMEMGMPKTLKRALHFLTDSEFVRQELIAVFGIAPEKITSVPLGVEEHYRPRQINELQPVLKRYNLHEKPYLLIVGTIEPRKNLGNFIDAYLQLPQSLRSRFSVVHIGPSGWATAPIEKKFNELGKQGHFKQLGYLPETELPYLYAGAYGFAFPSVYEGFGLPLLEAMACGVPVLAANRSSLPEIVGEAGLLVEAEDVAQLTAGIERLLTDEQFRALGKEAGPQRAALFTWEKVVAQTIAVYKKVLQENSL